MRSEFLPYALPDIGEAEIEAVADTLRSGWLTTGPRVRRFEAAFAARVGAPQAVAVNSCTAALHLALEALGLKAGDEVITTPYTFAATAEVVRYFNARPVFVDVLPDTLQIDPGRVAAAITPRTRALLPVHLAGQPADMDALLALARRHGLRVVEDAAHAFPSEYRGRPVGSLGDITCFSFYATKTLTTGEGGMLTTANADWADRCRVMALHGISKDAWKRFSAEGSWYYEIAAPGFKYNMTDIAAALGLVQLDKADRMRARREAIADAYDRAFEALPELEIPTRQPDCRHAWHVYMLRLRLERLRLDRAAFIGELKRRNIGTTVNFIPLHVHPYYRETYGYRPEDFPVAYGEYLREISLPIYSGMRDADVRDVTEAVADVVRAGRA